MDLLELLHKQEITLEQAENIVDDELQNGGFWWERIGITRHEVTAYAHSLSLEGLLVLRYIGWPKVCSRCGKEIDYRDFGWWMEPLGSDDKPVFHHIVCPD